MYDYLLELEDLERMLLIVPAEERSKIIDAKNEVADRMFSCFCISDSGLVSTFYTRCVLFCSSLFQLGSFNIHKLDHIYKVLYFY